MTKYGADELFEIQSACVSASNGADVDAVRAWVESVDIDFEGFTKFLETVTDAAQIVAEAAMKHGVTGRTFLAAVYCSGFEQGVRFQQSRGAMEI